MVRKGEAMKQTTVDADMARTVLIRLAWRIRVDKRQLGLDFNKRMFHEGRQAAYWFAARLLKRKAKVTP